MRPPTAILPSLPQNEREDLRRFVPLHIPALYPGTRHSGSFEVTHHIPVRMETMLRFKLPDKKLRWFYGFFFKQAYLTTSRNVSQHKFKGVYRKFTDPWFRGDFLLDGGRLYTDGITCQEIIKNFRSKSGSRIIACTLVAYYELEKKFCQRPLDYMLRYIEEFGVFVSLGKAERA